jgi:hypothetical protein
MSETKKYYIPSLDEFCYGLEFEAYNNMDWFWQEDTTGWKPLVWVDYNMMVFDINKVGAAIDKGWIRIKCLDPSDVASLGFEKVGEDEWEIQFKHKKGTDDSDLILGFWKHEKEDVGPNYIEISGGPENNFDTYFSGCLKNKQDLKRILRQIGYEQEK